MAAQAIARVPAGDPPAIAADASAIACRLADAFPVGECGPAEASSGAAANRPVHSDPVQTLLAGACALRASALHLRVDADGGRVDARIDGVWRERIRLSGRHAAALAAELCRRAGIAAEPASAAAWAEGPLALAGNDFTWADATGAAVRPPAFVVRRAPTAAGGTLFFIGIGGAYAPDARLEQLGFEESDLERIRRNAGGREGLILVVGPARSGKTATLHAILGSLDARARSIQTVESTPPRPHERWLQFTAAPRDGDGRGDPLRACLAQVLRNEPDVVLVEALRTRKAARLAMQALAGGCLVLSSVDAGRASEVFGQLRRLGVEPEELAARLCLVIAQRLLRRLCPHCAQADDSPDLRSAMARAANTWLAGEPVRAAVARPGGCPRCGGTGYAGLALAYELIEVDASARAIAEQGSSALEMEQALLADGRSLWDQGLRLLSRGTTSLDALREAIREPR
jgi:general secretion pathway protein E